MRKVFEGVGIAIVTPFLKGAVDFGSMKKLLEKSIEEGADAIIVLGTTGEGATISQQEREDIIKFCRLNIPKKVNMIVGTGNNNFEVCYQNTKRAKELGADAVLVVTPYYNKTTQKGLEKYYEKLAQIEVPMILYNVPARTGLNIDVETVKNIIEKNPMVYGLKESTCDINRIQTLSKICKDKIGFYSGYIAPYVFLENNYQFHPSNERGLRPTGLSVGI